MEQKRGEATSEGSRREVLRKMKEPADCGIKEAIAGESSKK